MGKIPIEASIVLKIDTKERLPAASGCSTPHGLMRALGLFAGGLLAGCATLQAASYWELSGATVDEAVAGPGTAPSLSAVDTSIPFGDFRYPHVDYLENVTFIVDPGKNHGIFRSHPVTRSLTELVKSDVTQLPASGAVARYIRGLQMDGEDFVFNATDSADGRGLYFWSGGKLEKVARTGDQIVPDGSPVKDVEYGSLFGRNVLYTVETKDNCALVLHDLDQHQNRVLLKTGTAIPGKEGQTFEYFSPQNWMDAEDVVFRAARVSDPHVTRRDDPLGVRGIYGWFGQHSANPDAFSLSDLRTIADWTTPIPGIPGKNFTDFRSAPVHKGMVAFVGSASGSRGVYFYDANSRNKDIRVIVDTETPMPSLFGGKFQNFGIFPTLIDDCVVFTAYADNDYSGVFLYDASADTLFVLADNRNPIEGKAVKGFEIASHLMIRNRFALAVYFEDETSGVYLATIPSEGFTRMGAPGM